MNYLLTAHERAYHLSYQDGFLSFSTLLSGAPYALRHRDLANRSPEHCLGHRIIAVLQAIPVLGLLFCLIERIVALVLTNPLQQSQPARPIQVTALQKVPLQQARQYDMPGNQPAACTFHAVTAMKEISTNFDRLFNWISENNTAQLSAFQRDVILNKGLPLYQRSIAEHPDNVAGADFHHILPYLPAGIELQQPPNHDELQPFQDRLMRVVDYLSDPNPRTKTAWIKTGNEESFAVVSRGQRSIIFDSHKNEMIGTTTKEALRNALREKLIPFSNEVEGLDVSPFAFAL